MNTAIKCGNCKGTHSTVEEVKACFYASSWATKLPGSDEFIQEDDLLPCEAKALASGKVSERVFTQPAITPKQEAFLNKLLAERPALRDVENLWPDNVAKMTKADASTKINEVLASSKEGLQEESTTAEAEALVRSGHGLVTEGYYAIEIDGTVKFYRVDKPTEGKWKGYTFVKVQASDEFHPIKNRELKATILATIEAQGVKESQARYGKLIGRCGICNRTLTDETSRAFGIGPVCRERF